MAKRYFNWKLAIVFVISLAVLCVTAFALRSWQRGNRAERGLILGNEAYEQRKWDEAAASLGRYLSVERNDVQALLKYADAQIKRRPIRNSNIQQAIAAYRTVLRLDKNESEAATKLTEIYLGINAPGEAELIAERYLQTNDNPEISRMLAVALARQRRFDGAVTQLKTIIEKHSDEILAYETLGQLMEQRPQDFTDQPKRWYDEAVEKNPSSALAYIVRAAFYLRSGDRSKALADLEQAEVQDLSDPLVRLRLAREFTVVGILDQAEQHLKIVQADNPTDRTLWLIWAELALRSASQEKMQEVAEMGLRELGSDMWDFIHVAAELFIRAGRLDQAEDCISKMHEKDIHPEKVAFLRGLVANGKGHTYRAVKYWSQVVELGDKSPRVRLALASAFSNLGDSQSALRQLRILVSEFPDSLDGLITIARLTAQMGNWAESVEYTVKAKQLSPENLEVTLLDIQAQMRLLASRSANVNNVQVWHDLEEKLETLEKATDGAAEVRLLQLRVAMQQGKLTEARSLLDQLIQAYPSQAETVLAEAELLTAEGKSSEAITVLQRAIEQFPQNVVLVRYLAILYAQQNNYDKCEQVIQAALKRVEQSFAQHELGLLLAQFYRRWGQENKAYAFLNALTQKLPNDIPVKRQLLSCGQVMDDPETAQSIVDAIKELEGEDGWQWRYEQARIWFNGDGFTARSVQILSLMEKNLLANPDDLPSRVLLAATYERSGELQLAISTYREALSRSPDDVRIIVPTVALLYKTEEYDEAEEILARAAEEKLYHPQLQQIQLQSHLRRGELSSASDVLQDLLSNDPNNQAICLSLALLKMRQSEFDVASELLERLRKQEPNSLPVVSALAQLNVRQNKSQQALQLCEQIVHDVNSVPAYILRARTYAALGQFDKTVEDFGRALAMEPKNAGIWLARSDFYRSMGRPAQALSDAETALSLAPDNDRIQKRCISLYLVSPNSEHVRQGKKILDKALESNPEDVELRLFKVRSLLAEGTAPAINSATQILQEVAQNYPQTGRAWVLLGQTHLSQGQPGKAIDVALRGLAYRPNNKELLMLKAHAEAIRSPILAVPTLKQLREMDPNNVEIAVQLAKTYVTVGESKKAVELLRNQLDNCNGESCRRCNIALAVALYRNGDKEAAQEQFDALMSSVPDDPSPLLAQIQLLRDDKVWDQLSQKAIHWYQEHPEDVFTPVAIAQELLSAEGDQAKKIAEDILHKALDRHPENLPALRSLAITLQLLDRVDEAARFYQQILEIDPNNVITINNLAWVLCEKLGKCQEALELIQRGLKIAPINYIDIIDTRGVIYYRLGQFEKAIEDLTRCVELYPLSAPASVGSRFHLARVLVELGQQDNAIEQLTQALDLQRQIGGLSIVEVAEARRLLEQLQKGS